jgi:hypothetical protein
MDRLRPCLESKSLLSGELQRFPCELVEIGVDSGLILFRIQKPATVGRAVLRPGCLSFGLFSPGDPFVTYCWLGTDGEEIGWYINVADSVVLTEEEFRWRDLVVDVLVYPDYTYDVLDEDQLPPHIEEVLLDRIRSTTRTIVQDRTTIVARCRQRLRPHIGTR